MKLLFAGGSLVVAQASAALVYDSNFETDTLGTLAGGAIVDGGTVVNAGSSIVEVGSVPTFQGTLEMGQVFDVANDSWINTGLNLEASGIDSNTDYTMAAWLNYPSTGGDRFVFGSQSGSALHLGTRGTGYHSGHWGDDVTVGATATNAWHYVVWTNDGATGTQEIFVDGASVGSGTGNGAINRNFNNLLIGGARNDTGRDFIGQIGGVAVYNEVLTLAQQNSIALTVAVPEPSRAVLLGLAVAGLAFRRRR